MADEEPIIVDNRAAARAERRKNSLYAGEIDEGEAYRLEHISRTRTTPVRWAPGHDPRDEETDNKGTGWETVKLEVTEHKEPQNVDALGNVRGQPSGVQCYNCKHGEMLIIDSRTPEEIASTQPHLSHALEMNRDVDPLELPSLLMLVCPQCKTAMQVRESVMRKMRGEQVDRYA